MKVLFGVFLLLLACGPSQAREGDGCFLHTAEKGNWTAADWQQEMGDPQGHFRIFFNATGDSAASQDTRYAVLEALLAARETYGDLGFDLPGAAHDPVHVYLAPFGGMGATVPGDPLGAGYRSHLLLDNDFANWGDDPLDLARVTAAHEYFHVVQFALDYSVQDLSYYEATAVWAEDQVYPDIDDWVTRYGPAFLENAFLPLDAWGGLRPYGLAAVIKLLLHDEDAPDAEELLGEALPRWPALLEHFPDPDQALLDVYIGLWQGDRIADPFFASAAPGLEDLDKLDNHVLGTYGELGTVEALPGLTVQALRPQGDVYLEVEHQLDHYAYAHSTFPLPQGGYRDIQGCQFWDQGAKLFLVNAGSSSVAIDLSVSNCFSGPAARVYRSTNGQWLTVLCPSAAIGSGYEACLYDIRGARLSCVSFTGGRARFRATGLARGLYIVDIPACGTSTTISIL